MSVNAFVDLISDHLSSHAYSKEQVKAVVRAEIKHILPLWLAQPPIFGKQGENQTYAQEIGELTGKLLTKLKGAPPGTRNVLYILGSQSEPLEWSLHDPNSPAAGHYKQKLVKALEDLQRACDDIRENRRAIGEHHNENRSKQVCAGAALDLIVGLECGRPTYSSANSPISIIAGALFEAAVPGQPVGQMKDQCIEVVAHWRQLPDADKRAHLDQLWANWEFTGIAPRKSTSFP
jgi:hypothetical protein